MKQPRSLTINILTLFPEVINPFLSYSILKRAQEKGLFQTQLVNIRDYSFDRHHTVDDKPYGGGAGMVLKIEPISRALASLQKGSGTGKIYLLTPSGKPFNQQMAIFLSRQKRFTLICGHYEGIDERVVQKLCDAEISVGDYILTGGELAAAVVVDAVVRLLPNALGDSHSALYDSFMDGLLNYPQYTRPPRYRQWSVPTVLLSGNHHRVAQWRREQQIIRTWQKRPDLLEKINWCQAEREFIEQLKNPPKSPKPRGKRRIKHE